MRKVVILSFLTSLLLGACGEDDYVYPNVLTDMIDLKTDHTGTGRYLITDEGTEWRIQSRTGLDGLAPDTKMGINELSMSAPSIPRVKEKIRSITSAQAKAIISMHHSRR